MRCAKTARGTTRLSSGRAPAQLARQVEEVRIRKVREAEVREGLSFADRYRASSAKQVTGASTAQTKAVGAKVSNSGSLEVLVETLLKKLLPEIIKSLNG